MSARTRLKLKKETKSLQKRSRADSKDIRRALQKKFKIGTLSNIKVTKECRIILCRPDKSSFDRCLVIP